MRRTFSEAASERVITIGLEPGTRSTILPRRARRIPALLLKPQNPAGIEQGAGHPT